MEDDGKGFPFSGRLSQEQLDQLGKGPTIIKERVGLIAGALTVESNPGVGNTPGNQGSAGVEKFLMNFKKSQPVRIVIADDHPIFRDGLRRLLEAEPDLKVMGEASDGAEAVRLARQMKPDILLLDLAMPKHPGLEALRDLSVGTNSTPVRVILLTAAAEKSQIVEALQLGARGVVLKDSATQLLLKAIHTVCRASTGWGGRAFPTWCNICERWCSLPATKRARRNSA